MSAVLIVGAGPTGLTSACGLAAAGVPVRVVDAAAGPSTTSRANILHARGVEVLDRAGALGDLRQRSLQPIGMTMHAARRDLATIRFLPDRREATQALFVSQAAIEARLRRRLADLGVGVEWGTSVEGAAQDADGVTVRFGGGATARVDWLVGCDGAHSRVRHLAGIPFPGVPVVEQFLLADVHADWNRDRSTSAGWFHRDGMLLAMPMPDDAGNLWRLMANVSPAGERLAPARIVARLEEALAERAGQTGIDIRSVVWTSVFRIQRSLADDYRRGRLLLAGDAAHIHSPIGGQGMNTGVGDAENLAWKLALVLAGRADPALLDTYTAERRPLATRVVRRTTTTTRLLLGEGLLSRFVRNRVLVPLLRQPGVQRRATRDASQLWVSYRRGPLGVWGRTPRPGDRLRDRPCRRDDGTASRLHGELGPAWALLAHPDADVDDVLDLARAHLGFERVVVLRDPSTAGALLVRPDAHLAARADVPSVRRWFGAAGVVSPSTRSRPEPTSVRPVLRAGTQR